MTTRLRFVIGLSAITVLLCASAVTTGCLPTGRSSTELHAKGESFDVGDAHDSSIERPFVDRAMLDPKEFGHVTASELGTRLGLDLKLPTQAAGGELQGIYTPSDQDSYAAVYSNDVVVFIRRLRDQEDAVDWIASYIDGDMAYHVTKWDLGGTEAYAIPKVDSEPVLSTETTTDGEVTLTKVKPGTGIGTNFAQVFWQRGRFVIQVMNPDQSIDALKEIARGVTIEPR